MSSIINLLLLIIFLVIIISIIIFTISLLLDDKNNIIKKILGGFQGYDKKYKTIGLFSDKYVKNNENEFVKLSDDDMKNYIKKNIESVNSFFKNNPKYKNKFIHFSLYPINSYTANYNFEKSKNVKSKDFKYYNKTLYKNPDGLWLSDGPAWINFFDVDDINNCNNINNINNWIASSYLYDVDINKTVLQIKNINQFKKFINKYKLPDNKIKIYNVIDWKKVYKDYNGLIITPYLADNILGKHANTITISTNHKNLDPLQYYYENLLGKKWKKNIVALSEWYRHWDISSGVIWNIKGINNINLITKLNSYNDLTDKFPLQN